MTASLDPRLDAQSPLRLIVWVVGALVAVAIFLTTIALLLEIQVRSLAQAHSHMIASLVLDEGQDTSQLDSLLNGLSALEGMSSVRVLRDEELASGVDGLLDQPDVLATLDLPTVIEMSYDAMQPPSTRTILEMVKTIDPTGSVKDGSRELAERSSDLLLFQRFAIAAIVVIFVSLIGIVAITVRSALSSHHQTLDLLRTMGAEDHDLAHQFEAKTSGPLLLSIFVGFLVGLVSSALFLLTPLAQQWMLEDPFNLLDPLVMLTVALVPAIAGSGVVIAIKTITKRYLHRMP